MKAARLRKADGKSVKGGDGRISGHDSMTWHTLLSSAFVASCFTSAGYLIGLSYFQTYMAGLKFNHALFPKSATDFFVYAVVAVLEATPAWLKALSASWQVGLFIGLLALVMGGIHYGGKKIDESKWGKRHRVRTLRSARLQAFGAVLVWPIGAGIILIYVPLLLGFMLLAPILIGQSMGAVVAAREAEIYAKGCAKPPAGHFCTSVQHEDGSISLGFVVDISSTHIAIVADGISKSFPLQGKVLHAR